MSLVGTSYADSGVGVGTHGRRLKLGVAGMGRGFLAMLATLKLHPGISVIAGTDPRLDARQYFAREFGARAYDSFKALCADSEVEAIYIASPHQFHREQVELAARHGKHVLVEKPMALNLDDCRAMTEAARSAGVILLVGHSHSFDAPIQRAGELIRSGDFGRLRMISAMNYTDFLYRPRRAEELKTEHGGGVVFSQASHQVDIVRTIAGGRVASVRAHVGIWDRRRPTESAYSALLMFEDDTVATLVYSGYGHFDSDEFCGWMGETGRSKDKSNYGAARRMLREVSLPGQEEALKSQRGYGGSAYAAPDLSASGVRQSMSHEHFGLIIASCEGADLRPGPHGVTIYEDEAERLDFLGSPTVPRREVIDELYGAVMNGKPPLHCGEWGTANLEVCLAILQSSRERREITLKYQVDAADVQAVV